jgi:hypothetical protein
VFITFITVLLKGKIWCSYLTVRHTTNALHNSMSLNGTFLNGTCHMTVQSQNRTCHRKNCHKTYYLQNSMYNKKSCSACLVLSFLFSLSHSVFPILPVLFCLSYSACPVVSLIFCMSCSLPVRLVLLCLSCPPSTQQLYCLVRVPFL